MKVCFISDSLVREREIIIGLNQKVDLFLVYPYYPNENIKLSDVKSFCENNRITNFIHDFTNRRGRSLKGIFKDLQLIKKIYQFNPDVIYIENLGSPYLAVFYRLFFGNKKTIISMMDYELHQRTKGKYKFSERYYRFIQLNFFKNFHFFSYSQEKLFKKDYPLKKSFTIRIYLVATDLHSSDSVKVFTNKINFLFFGRIFYYKGVDVLIKAGNLLSKKYKNFTITIAGDCSDWEIDYLPLIKNKDIFDSKIRYISKEELSILFQNADFFIVPYRKVTQSGPLLRAYNYNLIPIGSDEEGFLEFIEDNKTGFIFKNESVEDLARVMEKALLLSEKEKSQMINNIRNFKKNEFDIDKVVQNYLKMFQEVMNNSKM